MPRFPSAAKSAGMLFLAAALMLMPATGWAARESFSYDPPDRQPKGERSRFVNEAPELVFQRLWTWLEEQSFQIESVNPQDRIVVARYSGDPQPYLDCGTVTLLVDGRPGNPPKRYGANKAEVRTGKTVKGRRYGLLRQMQLDARLMVRVEPRGKGARVYSKAIYVVTQTVNRLRKGGKPDELVGRNVISFMSDKSGKFPKGAICLGNGKLESLPLDIFKKTS